MKCVICKKADPQPGRVTVTLERGSLTYVVKNVPARICPNCGEEYVEDAIAARLLRSADDMARLGAQVDIRQYMAA